MKNKPRNGFTLIEIIATVAIISIVFGIGGYLIINIINNSKNESDDIAKTTIKNSARIYVEENIDEIAWQKYQNEEDEEKNNQKYSCVSINELVNKNLLKKDVKENYPDIKYIIVSKDKNNTIISEEIDEGEGVCSHDPYAVKIPTAEKYCESLEYDGNEQTLVTKPAEENFHFENTTGKDADDYEVNATLKNGYHWTDGTTDTKSITCKIKKKLPEISLSPNGKNIEKTTVGTLLSTEVKVKTPGTLTIKSSNENYLKGYPEDNSNKIQTTKNITIEVLSSRKTTTYITITLTPDDTKNYYTNSATYTLGNATQKKVSPPTNKYCKNPSYNGYTQTLIEAPDEGYSFYNYEGKDIKEYTVTAKLKYGYIWDDETIDDKTIKCSIKRPTPTVTYDNNGGSGCSSTTVEYGKTYGTLCTPTRTGYNFNGWYTDKSGGTKVTNSTEVINFENHTIYARWSAKVYNITLNSNGATSNGTTRIYQKYNTGIYLDNSLTKKMTTSSNAITKPSRTYTITYNTNSTGATSSASTGKVSYTYKGHYTAKTSGTQMLNSSGNLTNNFTTTKYTTNTTLYAHWTTGSTSLATITKSGYTCTWNTAQNGSGTNYSSGKTGFTTNSNITLYAKCTIKPTCSVTFSGTKGNNDWYTSNVKVNLNVTNGTAISKGLTTSSTETYNETSSSTQGDTNGTTWYGYIKDTNGTTAKCSASVKVDTIPPDGTPHNTTTPQAPYEPYIWNPTNGEKTNEAFSLSARVIDNGSGVDYWAYRYPTNNNTWIKYEAQNYNSNQPTMYPEDVANGTDKREKINTTKFAAARNEDVEIGVWDKAGNYSIGKTHIYISYTTYMYACRSAAPDQLKTGNTNIHTHPTYNSTYNGEPVFMRTISTGTKVEVLNNGTIYNGAFYKVKLLSSSDFSTSNQYYNTGLYGYIRVGCLWSNKPTNTSFCTITECPNN